MRRGYSPFTHRTFVSRPSGGCQTSTIRMLASFQRYRAATSVAPGSNGRTLAGSWSVAHAGGLGPRSEGPHGAFRSRSRTDCRLKGFHSARSHSSSQDCRCTIRTASSWSTFRGALHPIVVCPARWLKVADTHCVGIMRDNKAVQRACRWMSPMLDRGLTTPSGRVRSFRGTSTPGNSGVPSSLGQMCSRSRCKSVPQQGDRVAIARCEPRFRMLSSNGTTLQVEQATDTEAVADLAQLRTAGREETAQQPIPAKLLDLDLPTLGATAQPHENTGQLRRDRRLSRIRPCSSDFRIKSQQQMQMVIHDRETTDGHRKRSAPKIVASG